MFKPIRTTHPLINKINSSFIDLPAPNNISIWWNYGSLLGLCLAMQIVTGLFLSMHYISHIDMAFSSVCHIAREVNWGWLIRSMHANGASMFFLFMYIHIGRGLYYGSFMMVETWSIGVTLFILSMATAFMGYVLPWGQMSFWGATVITNLFSAIPYIGKMLVEWIWGGFAVDNATLNRFFAFHFILPFIVAFFAILHLLFLHQTGSNNPLGVDCNSDRIPFHSYYSIKDSLGFIIALFLFMLIVLYMPNLLTDPENFLPANPLITPIHIKPEWYFLWMYAILRSIPNKLGGVVAMFSSFVIMYTIPHIASMNKQSTSFYPPTQILFWVLVASWLILTWIGGRPVEDPYITIGQLFTSMYFLFYILHPISTSYWDSLLSNQ